MERAIIVKTSAANRDLLILNGKITKVGNIKKTALDDLGICAEILDIEDNIIIPGLIDPHQHLVGNLQEIVAGGITTVVGCLGEDSHLRYMPALLAQAKTLNDDGLTAFIYSGGHDPVQSITGSVYTDMILIPEVIGAGEKAISDERSSWPSLRELAKSVSATYNGGLLSGKSGVTHFHLGEGKHYLQPLLELIDQFDVKKTSIYPTHMSRYPTLIKQAAIMSQLGVTVDFDCESENLVSSVDEFLRLGGDLNYLTVSSDSTHLTSGNLFHQLKSVMTELDLPLNKVLPLATTNVARILGIKNKAKLEAGHDADMVVLDHYLNIKHVIANGKIFLKDGELISSVEVGIHGAQATR